MIIFRYEYYNLNYFKLDLANGMLLWHQNWPLDVLKMFIHFWIIGIHSLTIPPVETGMRHPRIAARGKRLKFEKKKRFKLDWIRFRQRRWRIPIFWDERQLNKDMKSTRDSTCIFIKFYRDIVNNDQKFVVLFLDSIFTHETSRTLKFV